MKYIINGVFDVIKLIIILLAVFYVFDSGLVERVINMF